MRKSILAMVLAVALVAVPAQAALTITSISGSDVNTAFTAAGVLTISDTIELVVQYDDNSQVSYNGVQVSFVTNLVADNSGAAADGDFGGGSYTITANDATVLLAGTITGADLGGLFGGFILAGQGVVTMDSGSLLAAMPAGANTADLVNIIYSLVPAPVGDFSGAFTGGTNLTIMPIPEPATLVLLGLGSLTLIRRKRA